MGTRLKIGFLIFDYGSEYSLDLERGIRETCKEHNCTLYAFPIGERGSRFEVYDYKNKALSSLIHKNSVDGLLVASASLGNHNSYNELKSYLESFEDLPLVSVGAHFPGIPSVISNPIPGIRAQIEHLITKHHCKKIALFSCWGSSQEILERSSVYYEVLEEHGLEISDENIILGSYSYKEAYDGITKYAENHDLSVFDAIVCLSDTMAIALMDFFRANNIPCSPDDVRIVGFDNLERDAFISPTLTTVDQNISKQGALATETLIKLIDGGTVPEHQSIDAFPIYRQTCGCIPLSDSKTDGILQDGTVIPLAKKPNIAEWYVKKPELLQLIAYQQSSQSILALEELRQSINSDLAQFAISGAAICLYNEPIIMGGAQSFMLPNQVSLFAAFDNVTGLDTENPTQKNDVLGKFPRSKDGEILFDPRKCIVPDEVLTPTTDKLNVVALSHGHKQFGYFVYREGHFDSTVYSMLSSTIASILSTSKSFSIEAEKNRQLTEQNDTLDRLSHTDELTNILNRRGFHMLGQQRINIAVNMKQEGLVIFGDMDGLKKINDTYGHDAGDRAIVAEAKLLEKLFRSSDIVGRLGGDEFAVVAVGLEEEGFQKLKDKLDDMCAEWNEVSKEKFKLSISLGTARFSEKNYILRDLLNEADKKQYAVKRAKKTLAAATENL